MSQVDDFIPKAPECPMTDAVFCLRDRCVYWHRIFRYCLRPELQLSERARKRLRRERVVGGRYGR